MAGAGAREIKRKIRSVNSTRQITKAMELVSTAKLKRAKDRVDITRPYFETVMRTVQDIMQNEKSLKHDYLNVRDVQKTLYIVVSADRGLCGGYNINVLKMTGADMESPDKSNVITVGKKARDFFSKNEVESLGEYVYISEKPSFSDAQDIARKCLKLFSDEKVDEIKLVYTRLISTIAQEPAILKLLPIEVPEGEENTTDNEMQEFVTYEPSAEAVLSYVIPKYMESTIFGALVESSAAEQAARRIAMENASDNADDMIAELSLTYNQARQAAITQEISEIVGGAEALK
ncbi:ATP synthase F1 subunit gamma [Fusibacter sp. JL216-2]|uniref:ATP synthase F1 subunit gamma n=1 Tax=Fusibacter sp. JL216-2 TaxID=3071453 RepID=UPI003D359280